MGSAHIKLIAHPAHPPRAVRGVRVDVEYVLERPGTIHFNLRFDVIAPGGIIAGVTPDGSLPVPRDPTDGLWRGTCFELFAGGDGFSPPHEYYEWNFAPDGRWAGYRFTGYRELAGPVDMPPRAVSVESGGGGGMTLTVAAPFLPVAGPRTRLGLSAVIVEEGGPTSYWALRHPLARPDFHHRDCFDQVLGAPDEA